MNEYVDRKAGWPLASTGMMKNSILPLCMMLASAVSAVACIAPEGDNNDDETESVAFTQLPAITTNAITTNAITTNAITTNALVTNAITTNAITTNAITTNAITTNALHDPNARELLKYMVSCALLPSDHVDFTIDGVDYSYQGEIGLSPRWGQPGGKCDLGCQGWVSACVLARVDYLGEKVSVSLRGLHQALTPTAAEMAKYKSREGAYYGNIFKPAAEQERFACTSPDKIGIPRVCGPSTVGCVVDVVGMCNHTCIGPNYDGSYLNCRDEERDAVGFPATSKIYPQSITVFLAP
jgi:hypothetical protein